MLTSFNHQDTRTPPLTEMFTLVLLAFIICQLDRLIFLLGGQPFIPYLKHSGNDQEAVVQTTHDSEVRAPTETCEGEAAGPEEGGAEESEGGGETPGSVDNTPRLVAVRLPTPPRDEPELVEHLDIDPDEVLSTFLINSFRTRDEAKQFLLDKNSARFSTRRLGGPDHAPIWRGRLMCRDPSGSYAIDWSTENAAGTKQCRAHLIRIIESTL